MDRDRKDLKIQALLEKLSSITTSYENKEADLRVELTLVTQELEEVRRELANFKVEEWDDYEVQEDSEQSDSPDSH